MEFNDFIQWAFLGIVSFGVTILYQMKTSLNELNLKLAVFVVKHEQHSEKLDRLEIRIDNIEACNKRGLK